MSDQGSPLRSLPRVRGAALRFALIALVLVTTMVAPGRPGQTADAPAPANVIPVQVSYADGTPVPGAEVGVMWRETKSGVQGRYSTDATGRAEIPARQPGRYHLYVFGAPGVHSGWLRRYVYTSLTHVEVGFERLSGPIALEAPKPGTLVVELDRGDLPPPGDLGWTEIGLKRYYPNGVLSGPHDTPQPAYERMDPEGRRCRFTFDGLPAGGYRARTQVTGLCTDSDVDVKVGEGTTTTVTLAVGPPSELVRLSWSGPAGERTGKTRFNINPYVRPGPRDVDSGTFDEASSTFVTRSIRPGNYLLIFWDLKLAMALGVPGVPGATIDVRPPAEFLKPAGKRSLTVEVALNELPCAELPVLVGPARGRGPSAGDWYWMQDSQSVGPHVFRGLGPGVYDVLVLDGGFGLALGLKTNPVVRRVEIRDRDEVIRIDL